MFVWLSFSITKSIGILIKKEVKQYLEKSNTAGVFAQRWTSHFTPSRNDMCQFEGAPRTSTEGQFLKMIHLVCEMTSQFWQVESALGKIS